MLCHKCHEAIKEAERRQVILNTPGVSKYKVNSFTFPHYEDLVQVENAIKLSCPFCCHWKATFSSEQWQEVVNLLRTRQKAIHVTAQLFNDPRTFVNFNFYLLAPGEQVQRATMQNPRGESPKVSFFLSPQPEGTEAPLHGMELNYTGDFRVLEMAYGWLQRCKANHTKCRQGGQVKRRMRPQRLLDLGTSGNMTDGWSLVDGIDPDSDIEFTTVSHRWGDKIPLKLTHQNEKEMKKGMPLSSMTGEYVDAVRLTRFLGVRYMWVDSICVMQDDAINIKLEAQKMGDIYAGGICNLSMLHSPQESIFTPRYPCQAQPHSTILPTELYRFSRSYKIRHTYGRSEDPRQDEQANAFLFTRGWILQEQILPRRTIYFGSNQIIWACLEGDACELDPNVCVNSARDFGLAGIREKLLSTINHNERIQQNRPRQFPDADYVDEHLRGTTQGLASFEVHAPWDMVIERYSNRNLTDDTDKMIAIAGIASRYAERTQDQFVAGMWKQGLAYQLLWSVNKLGDSFRPEKYIGPTWSWASLKARIQPAHQTGDSAYNLLALMAEVVELEVNTASGLPFDIPDYAYLLLRGPSLPIIRTGIQNRDDAFFCKGAPMQGDYAGAILYPDGPRFSITWDVLDEAAYYQTQLWVVIISVSVSCHHPDMFAVDGLVLERVENEDGSDHYERLGHCSASIDIASSRGWWRRLYDAAAQSGETFPTLDFDAHAMWLGYFGII